MGLKTTTCLLIAQVKKSILILFDLILSYSAGQIELYTHHPFLPTLVQNLSRLGIRTCAVYLIESQFMEDRYKFFRCAEHPSSLIAA